MAARLTLAARLLLRDQRGVIADWQAPSVGLNRRRLVNATRDGWQRVSPHVFADRDEGLREDQMRMAGLLEAGPGSALAGCSALVEAGWRGSELGRVDVHAPRGRRRRAQGQPGWLRIHEPRVEPRIHGFPARSTVARAVLDASSWARSDREATMILTSVVQQRLVTLDAVSRELGRQDRRRRAGCIRDVLIDMTGGAESSNEVAFLRRCRQYALPKPRMQTRRVGGRRRTDAEFTLPGGRLLIVEIDGIGHLDVNSWQEDITRHNELAISTGAVILRVTGWEVRNDPDPFFGPLRDVLGSSR
jgi:very-short-patch-repair endonuclease